MSRQEEAILDRRVRRSTFLFEILRYILLVVHYELEVIKHRSLVARISSLIFIRRRP